jgi:hypothetical protein
MRETGAILIPTRTFFEEVLESRAAPAYAQAKLEAVARRHTPGCHVVIANSCSTA